MAFYTGSRLPEDLEAVGADQFVWVTEDAWCLVYGDSNCDPKVALFVEAVDSEALEDESPDWNIAVRDIFFGLAEQAGLKRYHLRFAVDAPLISMINVTRTGCHSVTLAELAEALADCGLPVDHGNAGKPINTQSSSSFHTWQRQALGGQMTATDLDLIRVDDDGQVLEVIEIKRSKYSLESWSPFRADFNNFRLLSRFLSPSGVPLTLSYHLLTDGPRRSEDTSELTLWSVDESSAGLVTNLGRFTLAEFAQGEHL
jgi:hypothetical protein